MTNASTAHGRETVDAQTWMRAAGAGDAARVKSLLDAGAQVDARLESGETALIRAASKGRLHVVRVLLEAGADPNAERDDGFTALGVAVFFGYADIVSALLAGGADPTAKGRLGTTAEKWALFSGYTEIVEMLRNPELASAQGSAGGAAAGTETTGAPVFFPAEGSFSPVVPLSKIGQSELGESDESPSASINDPTINVPTVVEPVGAGALVGADEPQESSERAVVREEGERPEPESKRLEPKEQEVVTVVRPRVSPAATTTLAARAVRPKGLRQSWPVTAVVLALSVMAGLLAGTYLMGAMRSAANRPTATAVEETAPAAEAGTQALEPQSAETTSATTAAATTSDTQTSEAPAQLPESAESALAAVADAAVIPHAVEDSKNVRVNGDSPASLNGDKSASQPAPMVAASENRRAPKVEPASRRETVASARAGRTTPVAVGEKTGDARRDTGATVRARRAEGRAPTSRARESSSPVFSPTPSAGSGKKKVVPWP